MKLLKIATQIIVLTALLSACGNSDDSSQEIIGTVEFEETVLNLELEKAVIRLLDISLADAPSITIAEMTLSPITSVPINFTLTFDSSKIDSRNFYSVSVEVFELNNQGESERSFVNMESFRVLTREFSNQVSIVVKRVN